MWGDPSIYHILPWIVLPSYPVLPYPTPNYTVIYCHPTISYLVLHWILRPTLDFSAILRYRTLSHILLHFTQGSSAILTYRTISYILPRLTLACSSILPLPTLTFFVLHWIVQPFYVIAPYHTSYYLLHWIVHPAYLLPNELFRVVSYCHPTLDSTPSYLILPHLTTPYPVTPPYPNTVLLHPTPSNHILHRPTLHSPASLPCPTLSYSSLQPTLYPTAILTSSYTDSSALLPCTTSSYHI